MGRAPPRPSPGNASTIAIPTGPILLFGQPWREGAREEGGSDGGLVEREGEGLIRREGRGTVREGREKRDQRSWWGGLEEDPERLWWGGG